MLIGLDFIGQTKKTQIQTNSALSCQKKLFSWHIVKKVNSSRLDSFSGCWWRRGPCLLQLPSHNVPAVHLILTLAHLLLEHQQLASAKVWNWHPSLLPRTPVAAPPLYPPIHPVSSFPLNSRCSDSIFICSSSRRLVNANPGARRLRSSAFLLFVWFFPQTGKPGGQIRLTAITGVQRRGGFSEPSAIFAPVLLLSFPQLEKIFYCTCTSYLPVAYPASPWNNEVQNNLRFYDSFHSCLASWLMFGLKTAETDILNDCCHIWKPYLCLLWHLYFERQPKDSTIVILLKKSEFLLPTHAA